jgi:hypothetical protein
MAWSSGVRQEKNYKTKERLKIPFELILHATDGFKIPKEAKMSNIFQRSFENCEFDPDTNRGDETGG